MVDNGSKNSDKEKSFKAIIAVLSVLIVAIVAGYFVYVFPKNINNNSTNDTESYITLEEVGEYKVITKSGKLYIRDKDLNDTYVTLWDSNTNSLNGVFLENNILRFIVLDTKITKEEVWNHCNSLISSCPGVGTVFGDKTITEIDFNNCIRDCSKIKEVVDLDNYQYEYEYYYNSNNKKINKEYRIIDL